MRWWSMVSKVIHIAGMPVQVGSEYRQRCAWCGEIIVDGDLAREMVAPGSERHGPGYFGLNELVEVVKNGGFTGTAVIPHEDGASVPRNCCAAAPLKLSVVPNG